MVPALEITFSVTVILVTTLLQLATPVDASTSITSPFPTVWPYAAGSKD